MRFHLVDRIVRWSPAGVLQAVKNLTLGEEYLADHFPTFPVMPGVLMLQTLVEAGAWLLRLTEDFRHSVIVLREAQERQVRHTSCSRASRCGSTVELLEQDDATWPRFKGKGEMDGQATVLGPAHLARYNLRRPRPGLAGDRRADRAAPAAAVRLATRRAACLTGVSRSGDNKES